MKKVFVFLVTAILVVVLANVPAKEVNAQAQEYQIFLPIILKPFLAPVCNVIVTEGTEPNHITFGINCQNVSDGWVKIEFDTLGQDTASTDVLLTNGVGLTNHDYPWPYTSFNARLTVLGQDSNGYQFDIPVTVNWP
jgi:hypothetical protein